MYKRAEVANCVYLGCLGRTKTISIDTIYCYIAQGCRENIVFAIVAAIIDYDTALYQCKYASEIWNVGLATFAEDEKKIQVTFIARRRFADRIQVLDQNHLVL